MGKPLWTRKGHGTEMRDKFNDLFLKMDQNPKWKLLGVLFLVVIMAILMFRLNHPTPWVVDDILKGEGTKQIHSFKGYFKELWNFYFSWGGRIWGEFFAYLFLSIPKRVFDIINTFGYLVFVGLIYVNITGKIKFSPSLFVLINFLLFACLPAFGQDILWISGTANYMWSSLIPLLYMAFWRFYLYKERSWMNSISVVIVLMCLGILSGWSNENVSVSLILLAVGYMWLYRGKYSVIPRFAKTGIVGLVIGSLLLWLAPGNFVRFASEHHSRSIIYMIGNVFHNIGALFDFESTLLLIISFVLLMFFVKTRRKKVAALFMAAGVMSAVSMSVVGGISGRVFLGCVVLMVIAVGLLYDDWNDTLTIRQYRCLLMIALLLGMHTFYSDARTGIQDYANRWNQNLAIIQLEKEKGNFDVYINPVTPKNKFCATYGLDDIKPKEENQHWLNKGVAHAFGLHTIQSIYVKTDK